MKSLGGKKAIPDFFQEFCTDHRNGIRDQNIHEKCGQKNEPQAKTWTLGFQPPLSHGHFTGLSAKHLELLPPSFLASKMLGALEDLSPLIL